MLTTTLADDGAGPLAWLTREPHAPNDLCVGPDGALYVTDPTRGRTDDGRLWRCEPATGRTRLLAAFDWYPNGLAFDADDRLWIADTFRGRVAAYAVSPDGLGRPLQVVTVPSGRPDGIAFDTAGNLVVAAPDDDARACAVHVLSREGDHLDVVVRGGSRFYTNVAFGTDGTLAVTDAGNGRVLEVTGHPHQGLALYPLRSGGSRGQATGASCS